METDVQYVPYQKCPKCNGQGSVSIPPHVAGDVGQWTSSATQYVCDVCNGAKIIPMCPANNPVIAVDA